MNLRLYQHLTPLTNVYPKLNLGATLALGLADELFEFLHKSDSLFNSYPFAGTYEEVASEIGDVLWYLSELCNLYEIKLKFKNEGMARSLYQVASEITGLVKKRIRGDDNPKFKEQLEFAASELLFKFELYIDKCLPKYTLDRIMQENINKLQKRLDHGTIRGSGDNR